MNALGQRLIDLIRAQGPMSIADFMAASLYDPTDGAYASRNPIGAGGDYVTSPEVSQTFGEMCGLWVVQTWHNQGRPKRPLLVELGPGLGTLSRDLIRTVRAAARKGFADAELVLVENSPVLKERQQAMLKDSPIPVHWVERFTDLETDRPVYIYANEFFDCLPIHQYIKTPQGWGEKMVTAKDDALTLALKATPEALLPPVAAGAEDGGVVETCPAAAAIAEDIGRMIARVGGAALIFDYGYQTCEFRETLQAVQRHKYADVLSAPGSCDLSAHVDFHALAEAFRAGGVVPFGPMEQGDFLAELGIEVRAHKLSLANPGQVKSIVEGVRRLIDPQAMGSLFKVLAVIPQGQIPPPGFTPGGAEGALTGFTDDEDDV